MESSKVIIEVRANEYTMRDGNPNVPWSAEELGRDAAACEAAGASIYHFHARCPDGTPDHSPRGERQRHPGDPRSQWTSYPSNAWLGNA